MRKKLQHDDKMIELKLSLHDPMRVFGLRDCCTTPNNY